MQLRDKLRILADAAKYDASCSSSGGTKRDSVASRGIGSNEGTGICHSFTPDGRCVSLLKILLTNQCLFDCAYCINRRSSNAPRAKFTVEEVVKLTLDFYKRNYIEGLFLSSGIIKSHDETMEEMVRVAKSLRDEHKFGGYIHLKLIAGASPELIAQAGAYADRVSVNVELPREDTLITLAPEKRGDIIRKSMGQVRFGIEAGKERNAPVFAPAGQSTQMIVGADGANDKDILASSRRLYSGYNLKRVYYSAFSPIPDSSSRLPLQAAPLMREHRLYQADWMMRFYGFEANEIVTGADGLLDLAIDPKLSWALANRDRFPVDVNIADRELLLRVPGLGEVEICRWWVKHELALVRPRLVVALGATALQSLSAYKGTLTNAREQTLQTREGAALRVTVHPSYLLRLPDADAKEAEFARFVADLRAAKHVAEHMPHAA